ncbi:MAG: universal stress protein [Chlorobi bacterium]|nr:universal stress protein [Chlorobiota bacterium]
MFKRILFPTDFSEASVRVKNKLKKMTEYGIGEVIMLHIMDDRRLAYAEYIDAFSFGNFKLEETLRKEMQKKLDAWKAEMEKAGLKVSTHIISGTPFTSALDFAKEKRATSIFLGHRGRNKKGDTSLGSTTEKITRKSDITVVLI